jgi:hypothetical protein
MDIALKLDSTEFAPTEVRSAVAYALQTEKGQARLRRDYYDNLCKAFEEQYKLSSDEFLVRFEQGQLGDEAYTFDWYAAKRGYDLWDRRFRILSEVSL